LTSGSDLPGRLIYFEDGVFKKSFESIEEIWQSISLRLQLSIQHSLQ
jgi:hypothetical protein